MSKKCAELIRVSLPAVFRQRRGSARAKDRRSHAPFAQLLNEAEARKPPPRPKGDAAGWAK